MENIMQGFEPCFIWWDTETCDVHVVPLQAHLSPSLPFSLPSPSISPPPSLLVLLSLVAETTVSLHHPQWCVFPSLNVEKLLVARA